MNRGQITLDLCPVSRRSPRDTEHQLCLDCGIDTLAVGEYYMVGDTVWPVDVDGMLCIGCLEARIGRRLGPLDFTDAPCNRWGRASQRLADRRAEVTS